ncbi:Gfo/Idh/MocA family protein [Paraliobacillus sediminis]|uniref:Gfo/Idh/MocA family protein n=1 Tax=Paraliobacillus sediminis TaxID=1885916 RepID=UPI000E3E87A1|nr:Gfo/Idh/MocA family oxidoreductase [Paraliobacillus sediminis]
MKRKVRVGVVGLGGIAQKAYLPILTTQENWELVGAFTPNQTKSKKICASYRMQSFASMEALSKECDAVFVHSSTDTHYQVVDYLLDQGKDVYVDKPLASNIEEAELLVEKSEKLGLKLMVGFNRRFAPIYQEAKELAGNFDAVHIEKHRPFGIGPMLFNETMLDDYLHVVDTVRWLANDDLKIKNFFAKQTTEQEMIFANHTYESQDRLYTTSMHRQAGLDLEKLEFITDQSIIRVWNMRDLERNEEKITKKRTSGSWQTVGNIRGFEGAIKHFITCIENNTRPIIDGMEGLKSQRLLQLMIDQAK